jgi:micrococcal nuclease
MKLRLLLLAVTLCAAACDNLNLNAGMAMPTVASNPPPSGGETARVRRVIDGDTIEVEMGGQRLRVRYVGVNTPESDEACYREALEANRALVEGQTVTLIRDQSNTDRFDRLLRYVYVGSTFVNRELVATGYAEAVLYEPDDRHWRDFVALEREAARRGLGCHPTGIFNDGSERR